MNRILLLVDHEEDRCRLREWLAHGHEVLEAPADELLLSADPRFDVGIVDRAAIERVGPAVRAARAVARPLILPFLLIESRGDGNGAARYLRESVDELILRPLQMLEVQARLDTLARLRRLSCRLANRGKDVRRRSESRRRFALRASRLGAWEWDAVTGLVKWAEGVEELFGVPLGTLGNGLSRFLERVHPDDRQLLVQSLAQAMGEGVFNDLEFRVLYPDGSVHWLATKAQLLRDQGGRVVRTTGVGMDVTDRKRAEAQLRLRERQQAALAELGTRALGRVDMTSLLDTAVRRVAELLQVEYSNVLELLPDGSLRLLAGVGWREGLVGRTTLSAGTQSQAGYTLLTSEPVVVEQLSAETRFRGEPLLHDHEVVSGVSVVIPGERRPFGVLGAHSARRCSFTPDDVNFVQAVANVLAQAIERKHVEDRLQLLLEQMPAILWTTDGELRLTYLAGAGLARVDLTPDGLAGLTVPEYLRTSDSDHPVVAAHRRALTGESADLDFVIRRRAFRGHIEPLRDRAGNVIGVVGVAEDVTERARAEQGLRASATRLRALVEHSFDAITLVDADGTLLYVSPANHRFFGAVDGDVGRHWMETAVPDDMDYCTAAFAEVLANPGKPVRSELHLRGRDGSRRWIEATACNLLDDPHVRAIVVNSRDVTERKAAEAELARSREQSRALSARLQSLLEEERRRIAREIHDELGQALTGFKMDLAWLSTRLAPTRGEERRSLLRKVRSMVTLVDGTVQTVRRMATELRPGVLDDLGLEAAVEWQAQDFQTRTGIRCEFASGVRSAGLHSSVATALFRIAQEALTNAARHAQATHVRIALREDGDHLLMEVADNGRGISEAEGDAAGALGLLGMRERARLLGGEVTISGAAGRGTTVSARIPLAQEAPPA